MTNLYASSKDRVGILKVLVNEDNIDKVLYCIELEDEELTKRMLTFLLTLIEKSEEKAQRALVSEMLVDSQRHTKIMTALKKKKLSEMGIEPTIIMIEESLQKLIADKGTQ